MGLLMGVDIGSTSIKAVVYDHAGKCVSAGVCDIPLIYPDNAHPCWCVWDPDEIWERVLACIRQALAGARGDVEAVAVAGFGMDGLPLDGEGNVLYPFISWHCMRTLPQYAALNKKIDAAELFLETGRRAMHIDTIYRIAWMRENCPEILDKTSKWLLTPDYINYRLCGRMATDYSMGSTTSAFDPHRRKWSQKMLELTGIPEGMFPDLLQGGTVLGEVLPGICAEVGFKKGTKVVLGGHDYICAALALGLQDKEIMDITGTWEILARNCREPEPTPDDCEKGYYIEGHVIKNAACVCISNVSGDMAEWFKRNFDGDAPGEGPEIAWERLMREAANVPAGSLGCTFLPHMSGSNAPVCEPTSLGAYVGLHNRIGKAEMLRATLEGLTYKTREMAEAIAGEPPGKIIAAGGAARNRVWMQMKADVTGIAVETPELPEATALGAAMLAGLGTGAYANEREASCAVRREGALYLPDHVKHELYSDLYQNIYLPLQKSLSGINARIHVRFIQCDTD